MGLEIVKSTYFRSCTIGTFSCFTSLSNVLKFAFKVGFERNQILVICSSTCVQRCSLSPHRILTYSLLAAQTPAPRGNLQIYYTACLIKIILSLAHTVQKHNFRSTRDSRVKRLGTHDNNIHDDNDNPLENTPHLPYDHPQNGDSGSDVKYCFPSKFFDDQATHLSSSFCNFGHHWILHWCFKLWIFWLSLSMIYLLDSSTDWHRVSDDGAKGASDVGKWKEHWLLWSWHPPENWNLDLVRKRPKDLDNKLKLSIGHKLKKVEQKQISSHTRVTSSKSQRRKEGEQGQVKTGPRSKIKKNGGSAIDITSTSLEHELIKKG